MRILGRKLLTKLKKKNSGNKKLSDAIDQLMDDLEKFEPGESALTTVRKDADCVHSDGFYFFNINIHRALILIEQDDDNEATIVWAGTHDDYERTFKNNKPTIAKWLRNQGYIE